jgi:hypothetical protein
MTPYDLGYYHAHVKLGVYNTSPHSALDYISSGTPMVTNDENLPAAEIADVLKQLGTVETPVVEKANGEETVKEREERMNAPVTFSTAASVPVDEQTGKLPISPGVL